MHSPPSYVAFPFAVLFVSAISAKLIHLFIHASAAPLLAFFFFLPTLFLPDLLVLSAVRLLLRAERGLLCLAGYLLGCFLTYVDPSCTRQCFPRPTLTVLSQLDHPWRCGVTAGLLLGDRR